MYVGRCIKCPLFFSYFHGTSVFSTAFRKILRFHENPTGSRVVPADARTDMMKLKGAFRDFANAPKKGPEVL
jgi:hypothetical protein